MPPVLSESTGFVSRLLHLARLPHQQMAVRRMPGVATQLPECHRMPPLWPTGPRRRQHGLPPLFPTGAAAPPKRARRLLGHLVASAVLCWDAADGTPEARRPTAASAEQVATSSPTGALGPTGGVRPPQGDQTAGATSHLQPVRCAPGQGEVVHPLLLVHHRWPGHSAPVWQVRVDRRLLQRRPLPTLP
jgi:hypothetical protein